MQSCGLKAPIRTEGVAFSDLPFLEAGLHILYGLIFAVINCGDPGDVPNAERVGDVFTEGAIVRYVCTDSCFTGGGPITCRSDETWSPRPSCNSQFLIPILSPLLCHEGDVQTRVNIICKIRESFLQPVCENIYMFVSVLFFFITSLFSHSGVTCPAPAAFVNGVRQGEEGNFQCDTVLSHICNENYLLQVCVLNYQSFPN